MGACTIHSFSSVFSLVFSQTLARDGYPRVILGLYNDTLLEHCCQLKDQKIFSDPLELAHILNESVLPDHHSDLRTVNKVPFHQRQPSPLSYSPIIQTCNTTNALVILRSFGYGKFVDSFIEVGGINQVPNLLIFHHDLRHYFDNLPLWFEPTETVRYSDTRQSCELAMCAATPLQSIHALREARDLCQPPLYGSRSRH